MLKNYEFVEIRADNLNARHLLIQNKKIFGMDEHSIYIGNIEANNKLEVIQKISKSSLFILNLLIFIIKIFLF